MKWLVLIAAFCLVIPAQLGPSRGCAEELKLTAADLWQRGSTTNLQLSANGKSLELIRGLLIENDGDAAGYSYKPNEELLTEGLTAYQRLKVEFPRRRQTINPGRPEFPPRAYLLVGHNGKTLHATVNGASVTLKDPVKAGNYWKQYAIPPELLVPATNEIGLSGDGKLWIAREDERAVSSHQKSDKRVQSSHKIVKGSGATPATGLGPKNDIAGEYYVRLYIDGYGETGIVETIDYDAANLSGDVIPPANVQVKSIRVQLTMDNEGELIAGIQWALKDDRAEVQFEGREDSVVTIDATPEKPLPRYFSAKAWLNPESFEKGARLTQIRIQTEVDAVKGWGDKLKISASHNSPLRHWDNGAFRFEPLDHPRLAEFRKEYALDEVVKGCKTDLERMSKLAVWTSQQWTKGHLKDIYPKWDALEILKKHDDGTPIGGFCQQYNLVFLQACESFGIPGRCVSIGAGDHGVNIRSGHEVVEIWSNELNKWVYVDGQAAWYFVDKGTRTPLNLLELRERQIAAFHDQPAREVEVVVLAASPYQWKGLRDWPAFTELRMIPHSQFLDGKLPLPLNQGMRGWFWTGHRVWTDDLYPASVLYSDRVTNPRDWNFSINQTQIWLQQREQAGELDVRLAHNMPSFAHFVAQIGDAAEKKIEGDKLIWPLRAGKNKLHVRAVNKLGLHGPASWLQLDYKP